MSAQQKTIQRLCALGTDDVFVSIKMNEEIKAFLALSAEAKGLYLSEECYLRLCESIDNDLPQFLSDSMNQNLYELIFNEELAVDEKQLRRG